MKKMIALLCVLFVLMPAQVFAHSKLTESSPAADAVVTTSPEQISLTFNTTISSAGRITLLNENGDKLALDNITVDEDTISAQPAEKLDNGSYTVTWNVIGGDGHAVEGKIGFQVELEEVVEPTATSEETVTTDEQTDQATEEPAQTEEPTPTEATNEQPKDDELSVEDSQPIWPYIVIGIVVIAILGLALRKRK